MQFGEADTLKSPYSDIAAISHDCVNWVKGLTGIGLIALFLSKLVWNEKEAIFIDRCFEEALDFEVLSTSTIFPENDGKLVKVTGHLRMPSGLKEEPYGIFIKAVKLKRRVQMYQWVEDRVRHVDDFDDQSYQYRKVWKDKLISSSTFREPKNHLNPLAFPKESQTYVNPEVFVGSFLLSPELKDKFRHFTPFTSSQRPQTSSIKMHNQIYYHSADIWKPTVGDWRVQFSFAGEADSVVSIIAKQQGQHLLPFPSLNGNSTMYIQSGEKSFMELVQTELGDKLNQIWYTRGITLILTFIGTLLFLNALKCQTTLPVVSTCLYRTIKINWTLSTAPWLTTMGLAWIARSLHIGSVILASTAAAILFSLKFSQRVIHSKCCRVKTQKSLK